MKNSVTPFERKSTTGIPVLMVPSAETVTLSAAGVSFGAKNKKSEHYCFV